MSPLPVVPMPDAEAAFIGYLNGVLDASVAAEWPEDFQARLPFVALSRGGGATVLRLVLDEPVLDFDILAATKAEAFDLATLVRAHMFAAEGTVQGDCRISRVQDTSLIWLPYEPDDGLEPIPRYVLVMSARIRPV